MNIAILGIPMDLGAGRRGVDMGASALRNAHLAGTLRALGHTVTDLGDVPVALPEMEDFSPKTFDPEDADTEPQTPLSRR